VATIITSVFGQQVICSLLPAISFHFAKVRFNTASFSEIQEAPYIGNESRRSWKQNGYLVSCFCIFGPTAERVTNIHLLEITLRICLSNAPN